MAERIDVWVLLPVSVEKGYERNPRTYEFENDHAYFEFLGGPVVFSAAPTLGEAIATLEEIG